MTTAKKSLLLGVISLLLLLIGYVCIRWYSYVFAKTVTGEIINVERVPPSSTVISTTGNIPTAQLFSFAIAIKATNGEIFTASTEDRQWAVAQKGQCAEVRFLPYEPWELEKAGTYHGARLLKLMDCPK
jgi:hypothetical protein